MIVGAPTVREKFLLAELPVAVSVAVTVTLKGEPVVEVGVPVIAPAALRLR